MGNDESEGRDRENPVFGGVSGDVMRRRLDIEMTRRGLAESRERALRLIMAGHVRVNSRPAGKPDLKVGDETEIALIGVPSEYASRGAYKLIAALEAFEIEITGRLALDVGASTGGFTDVLLKRNAAHVVALDAGRGQFTERLRQNARVTVMERTNIRFVRPEMLPYRPDLVTIDVSFISLRLVLPVVITLAAAPADIVALIKPQFEAGRNQVGRGGVVRDESVRAGVLENIVAFAIGIGLKFDGAIDSPIRGPAGNLEFVAVFRHRNTRLE